MTPLPLPRFTFLCGAPNSGQLSLAQAIVAQDESLCAYDFEEPLRMMVHEVFLGGYDPGVDLAEPKQRKNQLTEWTACTVEGFLAAAESFFREYLRQDILGRLALAEYERDRMLVPGAFERLLFRDAVNPYDIAVFAERWPADCLCIHCGALTEQRLGVPSLKHIWLLEPSLDARMHRLRHELEPVR